MDWSGLCLACVCLGSNVGTSILGLTGTEVRFVYVRYSFDVLERVSSAI